MTRTNNLWNLHKTREARITEDNKQLIVNYEMSRPTGLKKSSTLNKKFNSTKIGIEGELFYDQKLLRIVLSSTKKDSTKLHRLCLIIAYLLADEIVLSYRHEELPYYDLPHYFNFGGYLFSSSNRRFLIEKPKEILERGFELLNNNDSYFTKIVPILLSVNTVIYHDVRFFAEHSLLEKLAQDYSKISGCMFSGKAEKKVLDSLLKEMKDYYKKIISEKKFSTINNDDLSNKIEKVLSAGSVNQKGNSKDKIKLFLESFSKPLIKEHVKYVEEWNSLRSKRGLAHGSGLHKKSKKMDEDIELARKAHELLGTIVYYEFRDLF